MLFRARSESIRPGSTDAPPPRTLIPVKDVPACSIATSSLPAPRVAPRSSGPDEDAGSLALPCDGPSWGDVTAVAGSPEAAVTASGRSVWVPRYVTALVALDALALLLGGLAGELARFDVVGGRLGGMPYLGVLLMILPAWLFTFAASRSYERTCLGLGSEEYRRVANAVARFTALLALAVFLFRWGVARGLIVVAVPAAAAFALAFRYLARRVLHRVRRVGVASHRVLLVGDGAARDALLQRLRSSTYSGLVVVGVTQPVVPGANGEPSVAHVRRVAEELDADTVAVAHSLHATPDVLRDLAWSLEGSGVDLLVAPALTDVSGPRIHVRPVSGLPLLQIAEPEYAGVRRIVKYALDLTAGLALLLLLSPVFVVLAVAVRVTSQGPVLFRQVRIGQHGREFTMYKFRSMHPDAEDRLGELITLNDHGDGVLFKLRDDPRITGIGKVLRRYSLDELPQLFNVLRGQMSLVGPRPPLPGEVARYDRDVHRRLLVRPGITGLWQVSGRSDLDWDETVRLDLYYVENWSVALDLEIVWKTLSAVLRGAGAR